jgi:hypothetical protein
VKVLEKGRGQRGWSTEATCTGKGNGGGGCGAKLLVEQADIFETTHTDMKMETDHFATFKCVECGVLTDLPAMPPFKLPTRRP